MQFIHEELTAKIIEAYFEVSNELGAGFLKGLLTGEHQSQMINYLKGTGKEIGLLVNFGRSKVEYKRLRNPVINSIERS